MRPEEFSIGLLALQGGFASHQRMLNRLGAKTHLVKTEKELLDSSALILPGGESTTLFSILEREHLLQPLITFAKMKPTFGTCAGLIVLAKCGLLDIDVDRNAYGRQKDSFSTQVQFQNVSIEAPFIRAPKILSVGNAKILAMKENEIVMVEERLVLGATFHPELTAETVIHEYFLSLCHRTMEKQ